MGCLVRYRDKFVQFSNRHFTTALGFCLEVGAAGPFEEGEQEEFLRIKTEFDESLFWNGRGITIEVDMPHVAQQKLWARLFADTARAVFLRKVGFQGNNCWQARCITQLMAISDLFVEAVRTSESGWYPQTADAVELSLLRAKGST